MIVPTLILDDLLVLGVLSTRYSDVPELSLSLLPHHLKLSDLDPACVSSKSRLNLFNEFQK